MPGFVTPSGLFVVAGGVMVALPATGERLTEWAAGPLPCRHCGEVGGCDCIEWLELMGFCPECGQPVCDCISAGAMAALLSRIDADPHGKTDLSGVEIPF